MAPRETLAGQRFGRGEDLDLRRARARRPFRRRRGQRVRVGKGFRELRELGAAAGRNTARKLVGSVSVNALVAVVSVSPILTLRAWR